MSSTDYSSPSHTYEAGTRRGMHCCGGGHWSAANIAAMVLGFIVFVPLGFAVLIWSIMGRPIQELPTWVRDKWAFVRGTGARGADDSENVVFNEFQQTQYDRIREIKAEIRQRAEAFRAFRFDAKRRKDRQEFEDFMANNPDRSSDKT